MEANRIRCSNDIRLFDRLLEQADVKGARQKIESLEEKGYMSVRRRLLATSVRLSRGMAKRIHAIADSCIERLELDIPLELYVYSSPQFNAACLKPEDGRLIVMFSSSLLEGFTGDELRFVMGHELGHHLYRHHDIPIGLILNGEGRPSPKLALDLFAWSRYAEISADRAGAHCATSLNATALALFKLASGLSSTVIEFDLEDFLSQIKEMKSEDISTNERHLREDWFSTHPFSPLRVQALKLFYESEFARPGGTPAETLELSVQNLMGLMEPSYLEGRTEAAEAMRRLLFAAAVTVAKASGQISESEIQVFEEFFGAGSFHESLDVDRLEAELPQRIQQAIAKTSLPQRIQVIRDLCLVAKADGCTSAKQQRALESIASQLEVESSFVAKCLEGCLEPD
jgi:tellurite resistance protein